MQDTSVSKIIRVCIIVDLKSIREAVLKKVTDRIEKRVKELCSIENVIVNTVTFSAEHLICTEAEGYDAYVFVPSDQFKWRDLDLQRTVDTAFDKFTSYPNIFFPYAKLDTTMHFYSVSAVAGRFIATSSLRLNDRFVRGLSLRHTSVKTEYGASGEIADSSIVDIFECPENFDPRVLFLA